MKLVCSQTELNTSLQLVSRAVATRPTHPILANVLLTANAETGLLSLTGFDLNLGIQISISASVETSGAITLPSRLLGEIVSRLSNEGPITISDMKGQERIELTSISGTYQMRSMPAADFPDLPLIVSGIPVRLEAEALIRGLRGTIFATSNDEAKQVLTGVHLCFTNHELECAATDGHRLAVLRLANAVTEDLLIKAEEIKETEEEDGIEDFAVTLPARSLKELERLLSGHPTKEAVSLFYNRGQAVFLWANQILTSRTLDGIYPAYKGLIPDHFTRSIALERKALISALERVAVLAGQHNNVVRLEGDPMTRQLCISADAQEIGSGSEEMLAIITGGCIEIAFNVRYMLDGLKAMTDERIEILCNSSNTPAILTPQGDMHSFMYLIMPIQVRD